MTDLSNDAKYARSELAERPYNDTAAAIAASSQIQQVEEESMADGLRELQAAGLAAQDGGRWRLTQAGIDWLPS